MAQFFTKADTITRPGVYQRYENVTSSLTNTVDGTVAAVFQSHFGPLNEAVALTSEEDNQSIFGGVPIITQAFKGGASRVIAIRAGVAPVSGGYATVTLKDIPEQSQTEADAVTVTMKYPGTKAFKCSLKEVAGDSTTYKFDLEDGNGTIIESITFAKTVGSATPKEVDDFVLACQKAKYFTATKVTPFTGTQKLKLVTSASFTAGSDPTVTTTGETAYSEYATALEQIERMNCDCVVCDSEALKAQLAVVDHVKNTYDYGNMRFAIIGEASRDTSNAAVTIENRITKASDHNDYLVIDVVTGWKDASGNVIEGAKAAAYIAGKIASTPSTSSLTHAGCVIDDAVEPSEWLTNAQIERALEKGAIVFTTSAAGKVWVESAITTLWNPTGDDDAGWKKIKRAKIRFEMMARISEAVDPLIGTINNNADGRATVVQIAQGVLNEMVSEGKLSSGAKFEYTSSPGNDSAYFAISADDMDSLEKIFLVYQYRFTTD